MELNKLGVRNPEKVLGVEMSELDLFNDVTVGQVVRVHLDNGEIVTLTRTLLSEVFHAADGGTINNVLLSSNVRPFDGKVPVRWRIKKGMPFFHREPDNKLVISAIVLVTSRG